MLIRQQNDIIGTDREVDSGDWVRSRLVLRKDGMGHSVHETIFRAGQSRRLQYRNHMETVYCIEGEGEIESIAMGETYAIRPGTFYALNEQDEHILGAFSDLRLVCVFTPGLLGREKHDENHSYPLLDDDGRIVQR